MTDLLVPPTHIPKIYPICPRCGSPAHSIQGVPYADGYHRRHRCKDIACGYAFYTLTPYNGSASQLSQYPFKDRPLTEAEVSQRELWWEKYTFGPHPPLDLEPHERMRIALLKDEGERDEIDNFLVDMSNQLATALKEMEE